ncbi:5-methyltetrahydropteroyltriglutamate--homocysteine S-methyltransferase [Plasticicumulans acidivorans]|uniref:5-methyltetrahydropteroyltriglutamate--homocysteine methyltransferase n=1 Tax=Plasticicumulans acidivorans TaxID=886464 RepID=A0A317MZE7_9GAMM|nr:5-methyltetrahydropteroyltriglutamate--homocysteine S-methyltransferase [Plasticicumulans acidivorans]PWV65546.1 methionine synthase (B12-independent) [Plasticicumulans acidivorans]
MSLTHTLGFPRIGARRELKFALERYWRGESDAAELRAVGRSLRRTHWQAQREAGLDLVAVGDFAWYDQVLQTLDWLGGLPTRFADAGADADPFVRLFACARGNAAQPAMELTKWFDTNYHYLVPELSAELRFDGEAVELLDWVCEAQALGLHAKPVLIGPLTLLRLAKVRGDSGALAQPLDWLPRLLPAYRRVLRALGELGVDWVQLDEPALALDLDADWLAAYREAYAALAGHGPRLLLASYFGGIGEHAALLRELPIDGVHLDLVRAPGQLDGFLADWPQPRVLSAGIIDGRNIWRADLETLLAHLSPLHAALGERLWLAPSCSLLHVPVDLAHENTLPAALQGALAFAVQKLGELTTLARGLRDGREAVSAALLEASAGRAALAGLPNRRHPLVEQRLAELDADAGERALPFAERAQRQQAVLGLPLLPTTTIGSFPQTAALRAARRDYREQRIGHLEYLERMRAEIREVITRQEALGLDVLVHGEPERNDMVEYFGELLGGVATSANGWVQSYGSRCVKPPLIYGDVYRREAMTVGWSRYAQSLSERPVKGMLTGPVTLWKWSFCRDDRDSATVMTQLALALREEVAELEAAGIRIVQIDEPAFREGLPLRAAARADWLAAAVLAFRIAAAGAGPATQIHTHMCYSEFNEILPAIAALDADVITIETARSDMELLEAFHDFHYPNAIGPGVYDIHSPRVPGSAAMLRLLRRAVELIPAERLWVNPDCGLKTRDWPEVDAALAQMVEAARTLRTELASVAA